jgi:Domain of Unknown Function (DUF1080)
MKKQNLTKAGLCVMLAGLIACNSSSDKEKDAKDTTSAMSDTAATTVASAPVNLFDGKTLTGWHGFNKTGEVKNWAVQDSVLVGLGTAKDAHGGDIVTDKNYENFELSWDWKVSKGGNSGVMYHVIEDTQYKAPYETGPEYQVIDDIDFPDKLEDWQKSGADYGMYAANDKKKLNPVGQWNSSRLVVNKGHVEHWLNGEKVVEFQAWDDAWKKKVAEGKWKDYPAYGKAPTGKIALQDHGTKTYYKNIVIREL